MIHARETKKRRRYNNDTTVRIKKLISLKRVLIQIMGKEREIFLNFILYHLEQPTKFPRTIMTKN